jgi:hypothetical protein
MSEQLLAEAIKRDNNILAANGITDCRIDEGRYRKGNHIVHEARLVGGTSISREKAKRLLPHIKLF